MTIHAAARTAQAIFLATLSFTLCIAVLVR